MDKIKIDDANRYRNSHEITNQTFLYDHIDLEKLEYKVNGDFFEILDKLEITLIVSREYENFLLGLTTYNSQPLFSYAVSPHPSGIAFNEKNQTLVVASTRNPNSLQFYRPLVAQLERLDVDIPSLDILNPLVLQKALFYPGCYYLHDLAYIGETLYGNSVGQNAIIEFDQNSGQSQIVWWPKIIDAQSGPLFSANYLQMNSIAAGKSIAESFFSASTDQVTGPRPGHFDFKVEGRGVIFSGETRDVICKGLTRPHSARLINGKLLVDNSGFGEVGFIEDKLFRVIAQLPGWTRGLAYCPPYLIVGTSKILKGFEHYAPGLKAEKCYSGLHFINYKTGNVDGSLIFNQGNQIFTIEAISKKLSHGFWQTLSIDDIETKTKNFYFSFSLESKNG